MENKLTKILLSGMVFSLFLMSFASAITQEQHDNMSLIPKFQYDLAHGAFLFTSWGQANSCSVNADKTTWVPRGGTIACSDTCGSNKCALDIWYNSAVSTVNWNNWIGEVAGAGASFTGTGYGTSSLYNWFYVETYCCPVNAPPITPHSTDDYRCVNGQWSKVGTVSEGTEGWCASTTNKYYFNTQTTGGCYASPPDGWCVAPTADNSCAANTCTGQTCTNNLGNSVAGTKDCSTTTTPTSTDIQMFEITLPKEGVTTLGVGIGNLVTSKYPFKAKLINTGSTTQSIKVEAGFYTQSYAHSAGLFSLFSTVNPVASCVPTEPFVKTIEVTLNPGQVKSIEIDASPIDGFVTLPLNTYILQQTPLVPFMGAYTTCCQQMAGGGCAAGTGGYIASDYNPSFSIKYPSLGSDFITCGGQIYGTIKYGLVSDTTVTVSKDYHSCIDKTFFTINGTVDTNATLNWDKGLSSLKKIPLTRNEISTATSDQLFSSSCLQSSECLEAENYSVSCISIDALRQDGTITDTQKTNLFSRTDQILGGALTGAGVGAGLGALACGASVAAAVGLILVPGVDAITTATALSVCGLAFPGAAYAGALAGAAVGNVVQLQPSDALVKKLQAHDASSVGICTKTAAGENSVSRFIDQLSFLKITGNKTADGAIVLFGIVVLGVLLIGSLNK